MAAKQKSGKKRKKMGALSSMERDAFLSTLYPAHVKIPLNFWDLIPAVILKQLLLCCVYKVVRLIKDWGPDGNPTLPRNGCSRVRWENLDVRGHTLHFTSLTPGIPDWPFVEPPQDILVPAGGSSEWFTMDPSTAKGTYTYEIDPPIIPTGSSGPPDGPSVEAE